MPDASDADATVEGSGAAFSDGTQKSGIQPRHAGVGDGGHGVRGRYFRTEDDWSALHLATSIGGAAATVR